MSNDDHATRGYKTERLSRAQKRAFIEEFKLNRPLPLTSAVMNARTRAQRWRDDRHDSGLPDNRLLSGLALKLLLRIDAEKVAGGRPGLDAFFAALVSKLPARFDREATAKLLNRYREEELKKLNDS